MKFWDWRFWRIGKEANYNPGWQRREIRTNQGKWIPLFRGLYFRVDSVDYSKNESQN